LGNAELHSSYQKQMKSKLPGNLNVDINSVLSFQKITEDTVIDICKLSETLSLQQKKMVASNAQSIAQAYFNKHFWFRAIYADDTPVGFIMLYDDPDEPVYFIWRLMIAKPYQGQRYGTRAIQLIIDHVRLRPSAKELLVSCEEGDGSPEGFYKKLGFKRTGKMQGDEIVLSLVLDQKKSI
jgi:diamine N-acetyltransferase